MNSKLDRDALNIKLDQRFKALRKLIVRSLMKFNFIVQ